MILLIEVNHDIQDSTPVSFWEARLKRMEASVVFFRRNGSGSMYVSRVCSCCVLSCGIFTDRSGCVECRRVERAVQCEELRHFTTVFCVFHVKLVFPPT